MNSVNNYLKYIIIIVVCSIFAITISSKDIFFLKSKDVVSTKTNVFVVDPDIINLKLIDKTKTNVVGLKDIELNTDIFHYEEVPLTPSIKNGLVTLNPDTRYLNEGMFYHLVVYTNILKPPVIMKNQVIRFPFYPITFEYKENQTFFKLLISEQKYP